MPFKKFPGWQTLLETIFEKAGKIKRKQRLLISFGTFILFGGAFYALDYMPKTEEIVSAKEDVENLEQRLRTVKIRSRNLKKFREEHAKVKAEFNEALKLLPDKREIPNLLRSISQMGTSSNLEFRLFSPQPENARDFYMEIPVALEVRGDYRNVTLFFDQIGRMDRIVNILNISMSPEKPLSTSLITKCTAITYRFKGKEDVEKEAQKKGKK
jgi:type IV pilus assembly protein PilO